MIEPVHAAEGVEVYHGDCLDILRTMPDASIDSIVTDPPAAIAFMGRAWDGDRGGRGQWTAWLAERMAEALRVAKPGAHALVWALPRTSHWTALALEDAGWEIRDRVVHLFGQGFPKSPHALKPAAEDWWLIRKPFPGSVAANVIAHGTGALNIDGCRIGAGQDYRDKCSSVVGLTSNRNGAAYGEWTGIREDSAHDSGRWPTNLILTHSPDCTDGCAPGCPVAELDAQSGLSRDGTAGQLSGGMGAGDVYGARSPEYAQRPQTYGGSGGASRFFPTFRYEAKAGSTERPRAGEIVHPTVKPLALIQWLIKLVTPPGGVVLDLFAGSGTTGEAAIAECVRAILIEREADYIPLIVQRVTREIPLLMDF